MQNTNKPKVLIVGASAGTGSEAVSAFLDAGYQVTAFSRRGEASVAHPELRLIAGDATNFDDVDRAVKGQDAVVVTLGISTNPIKVRLFSSPSINVRSQGTLQVIEAMRRHNVRRLVTLTTYGLGETRDGLRTIDRLFFDLILKPQIEDHEVQEQVIRDSGLEWTIARPVHLNNEATEEPPFLSAEGLFNKANVSRAQVAKFFVDAIKGRRFLNEAVAISG